MLCTHLDEELCGDNDETPTKDQGSIRRTALRYRRDIRYRYPCALGVVERCARGVGLQNKERRKGEMGSQEEAPC